jgi:predicted negative regulator of RcsB-dependent stress response
MSIIESTEGLSSLEKIALAYENKKKTINTVVIAIALAVAGFFAYKYLVQQPNEEKASVAMMRAEQMFSIDSVNLALNGDAQNAGFLKIINKFEGTASANVAHFYAASCYMKMGDYANAIKQLKAFDAKGTVLEHAKSGLLGDAYMENKDIKNAIENFNAATVDADDDVYTPMYLQRLAIAYEKNNQVEDAKKAYIRIRDEFPRSFQSRDVEKSLAMLGVLD